MLNNNEIIFQTKNLMMGSTHMGVIAGTRHIQTDRWSPAIRVCVRAGRLGWWAITKSDSSLMCHPWESVQADKMKVNGYLWIRVYRCGLWNGTLSSTKRSNFYISLLSQSFYSQMSVSRSKLKGVINTKLLPFNFSPSTSLRDVCNCDSCLTSVDINGEKK